MTDPTVTACPCGHPTTDHDADGCYTLVGPFTACPCARDLTVTLSTCRACADTFEDETLNLHDLCGECEPLQDDECCRCGDRPCPAYGDDVPDHAHHTCAACDKELAARTSCGFCCQNGDSDYGSCGHGCHTP